MNKRTSILAAVAAVTMLATGAFAQRATEVHNTSPLVEVKNEPAPKLFVGAALPDPLTRGVALIPYRVQNIRILPILGAGSANVSPRIGHLHVTIDDLPWHWADFSENARTIVVAGLPPGQHKLTVELSASADHHIYASQTVTFTIPDTASNPETMSHSE